MMLLWKMTSKNDTINSAGNATALEIFGFEMLRL